MEKYFIDDAFKTIWPSRQNYYFTKGEDGIIQINYPVTNKNAPNVGLQYHPTIIAAYALSQFNMFIESRDTQLKKNFLKYTDWLVGNLIDRDRFAAWNFNFNWESPGYKCKAPWISSMTQGMGISALVRAWELTGNSKYITAAERALTAFEVPISSGGLLRTNKKGDTWYEGTPSLIGAQVLNQVLFSLIGLYEMKRSTGNIKAEELFDRGIVTIRKHLRDFDFNLLFFKWSKYDNRLLFGPDPKYSEIQIKQLKWLSEVIGDDLLASHYKKWEDWHSKYSSRRLIRWLFGHIWSVYVRSFLRFYTKYLQR
jgi:hypothetical protein